MKVNVAELKAPGSTLNYFFKEELSDLDFQGEKIPFLGPVFASLTGTKTKKAILLTGRVKGAVKLFCSRCLEPITYLLETEYNESFYPETLVPPETWGEEAHTFKGDTIEITETVKQSFILALPLKLLCTPDCQGLCPRCGQNLNGGKCNCPQDEEINLYFLALRGYGEKEGGKRRGSS